ncbi:MAG: CRISPR-associated protein Cas4 [Candidatus Jettenia sp.]|uniref:CRISPR-associated exonuclease Cas4 n=1 Tax=Candidatus Jettenia caeni TaxID=247490 RepID=I3IP77_9BACT|nr:CRISPR-associated protein Cas4 [Candidatus Jettenia sp. AMX1]MBC6929762.1 CRISPR-associated protein Cas4 [Candidatus Jettenia sp.]WKZ15976.1 MAG: CRISPR-associated protein Cas4 [Candidatus Jettenia caeni]KAA0248702.1 MAG: CRISPR-associated protein Cas4 [Candidatus Jettenia sp. AMX1]MCE7880679.1 CRISPR-associated protein Cas4 [Candidatus Jettenia sp. AMX1]MCQ3927423.1 CRISPR-associated protein Cas4 [Candidatus Jettenia sp.]
MNSSLHNIRFTGTQINYFFLCKKKLWYFSHDIQMEQNSDAVYLGKLIHETSYEREKKEIDIDDTIKIDFIGNDRVIHEVKKSDKVEEPHIWQLKYYIWYLKQKGADGITGKINYPKLRKTLDVFLEPEDEEKIQSILKEIQGIINTELPPAVERMKMCRNCSYGDICWV